ncbi:MAG: hypothetical protein CM1200mP35_05290 [Chloroflexota bacterium]|nr:MAG: hypothetical protein CM1200mP35_05290 [Chloroflexota bacterium]
MGFWGSFLYIDVRWETIFGDRVLETGSVVKSKFYLLRFLREIWTVFRDISALRVSRLNPIDALRYD